MPVLASMFFGGIIGGAVGLPIGLVIAWFLPTPKSTAL
jgi:hypothetical protein